MRYADAEALRDDLRRYRSGEPVLALAAVGAAVAPPLHTGDTGSAANVTRAMPRTTANPAQGATTVMARSAVMPPQTRPSRNNWYGVAAFIALLLLLAGGILLFNALKNDEQASSFPLDDVVGLPLDEATTKLEDAGLAFNPIEFPTPEAVEGAVVKTDPIAGTIVNSGQAIDVYYNPIKAPQPIPDVGGMTVEEATSALTGAGFTVSPESNFVIDSTLEPGRVLSTTPPFGESAVQGTVVTLTVSKAPDQVSVPDLTGQAGDAAAAVLQAEPYLFEVTVTQEANATVAANTVIRTDPALNTPVAKGSKVTLIVSSGPADVKVPPVEGLTEAAARNQLTQRGLVAEVQYVTVAIGSPDDGHVISQSIPPTESVAPGTTIRLKVGKAAAAPTTTTSTTLPPTTTAPPTADLSITKTSSLTGSTVTYTITARNAGPSGVTGARVSDAFPSGLVNPRWTCDAPNCPGNASGDITAFTIDLDVNGTVIFTVTGTINGTPPISLSNTATIAPPNGVTDPAPGNNSATDSRSFTPTP